MKGPKPYPEPRSSLPNQFNFALPMDFARGAQPKEFSCVLATKAGRRVCITTEAPSNLSELLLRQIHEVALRTPGSDSKPKLGASLASAITRVRFYKSAKTKVSARYFDTINTNQWSSSQSERPPLYVSPFMQSTHNANCTRFSGSVSSSERKVCSRETMSNHPAIDLIRCEKHLGPHFQSIPSCYTSLHLPRLSSVNHGTWFGGRTHEACPCDASNPRMGPVVPTRPIRSKVDSTK